MSSMETLDVGLANELKLACRRNGLWPEDLKWLCEGSRLDDIRNVRLGNAMIVYPDHFIDLSTTPKITKDLDDYSGHYDPKWSVMIYHTGKSFGCDPRFKWDASKVKFQHQTFRMRGEGDADIQRKLMRLAESQRVFNTNLLDHLLAHPHLIPKSWKRHTIRDGCHRVPVLFIGTIFTLKGSKGYAVRGMTYDSVRWVPCARSFPGPNIDEITFVTHI